MCERRSRAATLATLLLAALAIPAAVWLIMPDMPTYRGLSGLDSALFALLAALVARDALARRDHARLLLVLAAAALFTAKTSYELLTGDTLFVNTRSAGFQPLVLAHAVGAAAGVAVGLAPLLTRRTTRAAQLAPRGSAPPAGA